RGQGRHQIVLRTGRLKGVIDTPEPPHAGDIMLGDMAMEGVVTSAIRATARTALDHLVIRFARTDRLNIQARGAGTNGGKFYRPGSVGRGGKIKLGLGDGFRRTRPSVASAVKVVRMD